MSRDLAERAAVYLRARTHYGAADPTALSPLEPIWRTILGDDDLHALDALFARVIWIADGELDALDAAAREYRAIIGPPEPDDADGASSGEGMGVGGHSDMEGADAADRPTDRSGNAAHGDDVGAQRDAAASASPTIGSLADVLEHAIAEARTSQVEQLEHEFGLEALLDEVTRGRRTDAPGGSWRRHRRPERPLARPRRRPATVPRRDRPRARYATRLRQAITLGTRTIDKRTPGGRFDGRAHGRGQAQRAAGRPVSTHPWRVTRQISAPIQEPHVALVIDISGSMGAYEYALGPIAWILTDGLRQIGGRCAIALFGSGATLLSDGRAPLRLVPGIRTGGGTAFAGDALVAATDRLEMTDPRRLRFIYVISDGGW